MGKSRAFWHDVMLAIAIFSWLPAVLALVAYLIAYVVGCQINEAGTGECYVGDVNLAGWNEIAQFRSERAASV